jgi:hypothetical protein
MNPPGKRCEDAFTRIELIVVVLVLVVSACVLLPQLAHAKRTAQLSHCGKNLNGIILAHLLWVNDRELAALPGQISTNDGGTMEYLQKGELFRHFQSLSNELFDPTLPPPFDLRVLVCPSDNRQAGKSFATLANSNLSYFVNGNVSRVSGKGIDFSHYSMSHIAVGDRNVTSSVWRTGGVAVIDPSQQVGWSRSMHNKRKFKPLGGNVAYLYGSVSNLTSAQLQAVNSIQPTNPYTPALYSQFPLFLP